MNKQIQPSEIDRKNQSANVYGRHQIANQKWKRTGKPKIGYEYIHWRYKNRMCLEEYAENNKWRKE